MPATLVLDPGTTIIDLQRWQAKMGDLSPFLLAVGAKVSEQYKNNFSQAPWTPLAAATITRKQYGGFPLDILVRTSAMRDAAEGGAWTMAGKDTAVLGVPGYSTFHFEGTGMMPARDYAFLPGSFGSVVEEVFAGFLDA